MKSVVLDNREAASEPPFVKTSWKHVCFRLLRVVVLVYVGIALAACAMQERLIFYPQNESVRAMEFTARAEGLLPWRTKNRELIGWRTGSPEAEKRLLIFHGNAGHALYRGYYADLFQALGRNKWEIVLCEYPGYGARPGKPSEQAFQEAAMLAAKTLLAEDSRPLYLLGESLGSGPACWLADAMPEEIAGVILVTPFYSLADAVRFAMPFLPGSLLLRHRFENAKALTAYKGPVLFVLAGRDEVLGLATGERLAASYQGAKRVWIQPEAGHNSVEFKADLDGWSDAMRLFD